MTSADELRSRLDPLLRGDREQFRRRIRGVEKVRDDKRRAKTLSAIAADIDRAAIRAERRRSTSVRVSYPSELPITERRQELLDTIRDNQVVIVAGETGSGKSTQLPKLCLELGRGVEGLIGHTQPRRLAARTIAERVAEELGTEVSDIVGYTVRFTDEVSDATMVKLMTDGILLAEIQRDRTLSRYDTIIIDEAHERSLNIDFLLGYLHQLLPRRPDLKVIITSATIDTERFAAHFRDAPIVSVSGRTYPVEMRYRPLDDPSAPEAEPRDQPQAVCDAAIELLTEVDGDILVFCSGEREIRDAADALDELGLDNTEVVPLFARLSSAEQHRVFESHRGRRIVVATNVAETSLTVPGIRSVIDPGTARISRFSRRTKVQRLPIEAVSQASANQRAGRCGRLGPGVCIRLYSEDDFRERPAFTEPEIQRTNLASVILQMAALGLGDVESFPFVDPPDTRAIGDGIALLEELGAVDRRRQGTAKWLTPAGRRLARLPIDPRLGRMLLAAGEVGCLDEVLVIAAGLSIQDPRERPQDKRAEADEHHRQHVVEGSDFLTLLQLWTYLREERRSGSSSRFRRMCRREFLSYPRVREWQDIHTQLRQGCDDLGLRRNSSPAEPETIHRALLGGLLSQVGVKDRDTFEYRGARNIRFAIAPGSALFRKGPRWVMAGELTETNRLWARMIAGTQPEWIEQAAPHLVKRSYTDPHWDRERGAAVAKESVSLYGLPLVGGRTVMWGGIDEADARDLFIHHALVWGEWDADHAFLERNNDRIADVRALEARRRRADLLIGDEQFADWFAARIPADITSTRHFDRWWKQAQTEQPDLLDFEPADLIDDDETTADAHAFPDSWPLGDLELALSYEFDPASPDDGVTIEIPVSALGRTDAATFEWLVPGLRPELVTALVRSMPKTLRRSFVPIPETVAELLPRLQPDEGGLRDALRRELARMSSMAIPPDALDIDQLPLHLRPNYRIVGDEGEVLATGGDLEALKRLVDAQVRSSLESSGHELERSGLTEWTIGDLPRIVDTEGAGHVVRAYPSLIDEGATVGVQLLATEAEQHQAMWAGTRRLLLLNRPAVSKVLRGLLTNDVKLALVQSPYATPTEWFDDLLGCAVDALMIMAGAPAWTAAEWADLLGSVRAGLPALVGELGQVSAEVLGHLHRVESALHGLTAERLAPAAADMRVQLDGLVYPGFLTGVGARNLSNIARYLRAIERRIERLPESPERDRAAMARVHTLEHDYHRLVDTLPWSDAAEELAWQLQELRVSLFAQSVGVRGTVSEKRIRNALNRLADPG